MSATIDPPLKKTRTYRYTVAMFATVASVLIHVCLLYCLPGLPIGQFFRTVRPQRIMRMVMKELRMEPEEATTSEEGGAGAGAAGMYLPREVIKFVKPADTALVEPSPVRRVEQEVDLRMKAELPPTPSKVAQKGGAEKKPQTSEKVAQDAGSGKKTEQKTPPWIARQEIMLIEKAVCPDDAMTLPRRYISDVTRISNAPDMSVPVDRMVLEQAMKASEQSIGLGSPEVGAKVVSGGAAPAGGGRERFGEPGEEASKFGTEKSRDVTNLKPIEKLLAAEIHTYTTLKDREYGYFRIDIYRAGEEVLPVLPKDVMLIQDCSNSMTDQRIHFCRDGLTNCLMQLGQGDRFNAILFRDQAQKCFPQWASNDVQSREQAVRFVQGMTACSNTDIFASIKEFQSMEKTPGRPAIGILITDGRPTVGLTDSSRIIEEFSRLNEGAVSVFALGTIQSANSYLLDLLTCRNRGDSLIISKGRWDIPDAMQARLKEVSRPVLSGLRFRFSQASGCEVYPLLTSNLYLDRPLVLYGRYPRGMSRIAFQVVGSAGDTTCDMLFQLDIAKAKPGDKNIRANWGWQKVLHLFGEYAGSRKAEVLKAIRQVCYEYGLDVPYRKMLNW